MSAWLAGGFCGKHRCVKTCPVPILDFSSIIANYLWYLYLYKIESLNLGGGVLIVQKCEALHMICLRIQHGMESNMGYLDHQFSHYSAKYAWLKFCTGFVAVQGGSIHFSHFSSFFGKLQRDFIKILSGNKPLRAILLGFPSSNY